MSEKRGSMGSVTPENTLAVCLLVMAFIVGIWDVFAYTMNDGRATVSHVLGTWAKDFPMLPLFIGMILGHLFWPRDPPR